MKIELNKSYKGDCVELMKYLPDGSVDVILTDPPYLYLKNQKLDRPFDEAEYFKQVKRVLKKDGFIVLFGRGTSFYRWNTILADLGFNFKEEVVWDKKQNSIPASPILRIHETISIHSKGSGKLNKSIIPYLEQKGNNINGMVADIKRISSALGNISELDAMIDFLDKRKICYSGDKVKNQFNHAFRNRSRAAATMQTIITGTREKSIFQELRNHYKAIHPTEKPVRLLERLLALVCKVELNKPKPLVLDTFRGSASTDIACMNFGVDCISFEIDDEYFEKGEIRKTEHRKQLQPNLFGITNIL